MTEPAPYSGVKHGAGFLASGVLATGTDATVLLAMTRGFGLGPFSGRIIAIGCAIVVGYFAHRRLTFGSREPASFSQFSKFVSIGVGNQLRPVRRNLAHVANHRAVTSYDYTNACRHGDQLLRSAISGFPKTGGQNLHRRPA